MALTIGITGGIGSGKSTVCQIFKIIGIPVFEADLVAKNLINSNAEIKNGLAALFGREIYGSDNRINRKMLANLIFNDDLLLNEVNRLVHPVVRNEFLKWMILQDSAYIIHEAAILFETGFYKMMDYTILISAPEEMRIDRVSKRENITPEMVRNRIAKQWPDEEKRQLANLEFINDNKTLIIPQILEIDKKLKTHGKIW
jgi:dephospho-CoA kinase